MPGGRSLTVTGRRLSDSVHGVEQLRECVVDARCGLDECSELPYSELLRNVEI